MKTPKISRTECWYPFMMSFDDHRGKMYFPCGKCLGCKTRLCREWIFRLQKEEERCTSAFFVTLTYDKEHIPVTKDLEYTLNKEHVQYYIKRLRYLEHGYQKGDIKYFAVGEYGSKRKRPHYHLIIFNVMNINNIYDAWKLEGKSRGRVHVDEVNQNTIAYTVGYVFKPHRRRNDEDTFEKEFRLFSSKLGDNYITDGTRKYHLTQPHKRYKVRHKDGTIGSMPRYYKEKLYSKADKIKIAIEAKKVKIKNSIRNDQIIQEEFGISLNEYMDRVRAYRWEQVKQKNKKRYHD